MSSFSVSKDGSFLLILLIGIFLGVSVLTTSVIWIEPTELGLASKLPMVYWIGFILLGILWYTGKESRYCLIAALILTVSYLYFAPAVIRATPWISNSYYPFGEALLINSSGGLDLTRSALFVSYLDWPIFLYLASALTLVTGIPHDILIKYFPLLMVSLYALFSVLILRTKLKLSLSLFGAAWVLSSFFIRQQYFGPQSVAYVFFLIFLLLASWIFFDERGNKRVLIGLLIFLSIVTTFTHPLTSLMSIFVIFAIYLSYRLVLGKSSTSLSFLFLLLGAIWLGYNIFITEFFNTGIQRFSNILFGERALNLYSESGRIIGSDAMALNFISSWTIVGLGAGLSVISIFLIFRTLRRNPKNTRLGFSFFMVFLLVLFGLFAFVGEYGAHESYQRSFMFALIPVSYLCVTLLAKKPMLLVVCLVGLLFLNIPAQYGGDTYRLATKTQLAGAKFIADNSASNISLVGKFSLYVRYYDPLKGIEVLSIGLSFPFNTYNSSTVNDAVNEALKKADYFLSSDLQTNYYEYFLGFDPLEQFEIQDKSNLIYNNGHFRLYSPLNVTIQP